MPMQLLDLFSGIGGFSLGLERSGGFKTVAFCEIDPFCRKVLAKHWPKVPIYDDVRTMAAYRTSEAPGNGFIRARSIPRQSSETIQRQSAVNVGRFAPSDKNARQNQSTASQGAEHNSEETIDYSASISLSRGADYQSADPRCATTRPSMPNLRGPSNGCRPYNSSITRWPNGNIKPSITMPPLSHSEVQTGQKGGSNGSLEDVGPIDVICGGFP